MSRWKEFFRASWAAAVAIILPILLLAILFEKVVSLLAGITTPFAKAIFPASFAAGVYGTRAAVVLLFAIASLGLGLLAQTKIGRSIGRWLENHTLMHLKIYRGFKEFSARLLPSRAAERFQPAMLVRYDEMIMLIYVVESVGDDCFLIYVPSTPTVLSGALFIVPKTDVQILPVKPIEIAKVISQWGVGTEAMLEQSITFAKTFVELSAEREAH